jgi:hypothetical protein
MDVSSYLDDLRSSIANQVRLAELFGKRIELYRQKLSDSSLTSEELIECEISLLKTAGEVETLNKIIKEKQSYFEEYSQYFQADLQEANQLWETIIKRAKEQVGKNSMLEPYLKAVDEMGLNVNADYDKKVFVYKRIKSLLHGR